MCSTRLFASTSRVARADAARSKSHAKVVQKRGGRHTHTHTPRVLAIIFVWEVEFIYCSIEGEIYWNLMLKVMMITFIEYLNVCDASARLLLLLCISFYFTCRTLLPASDLNLSQQRVAVV